MKQRILRSVTFLNVSAVFLLAGCAHMGSVSAPQTSNKTAHRIHRKLGRYAGLAKVSWQPIHPKLPLKYGQSDPAVPVIRSRLITLGDLSKAHASQSQHFGDALRDGIANFQWRHGLKADGTIGQKTLAALNISPKERYAELVKSMSEWAKLPENEGSHYVHVNIPSFSMSLVKDGNHVIKMKVIAGKPSRPTPTLYSKLKTIVFNPHWNVPPTIVAKDVIPGMRKNPNYLNEHYGLKVYSSWQKDAHEIDPLTIDWHSINGSTFPYKLSAPPGSENPLGRVKFIFNNDHDVYMHDTPSKGLFKKIHRAYSSGCIRLEKPFHLVEYFYDDNSDLDHEQVSRYLSSNQTKYVQLKNPVPVHITYITAWVDRSGYVHFREDLYKKHRTQAASDADSMPEPNDVARENG